MASLTRKIRRNLDDTCVRRAKSEAAKERHDLNAKRHALPKKRSK